MWRVRSFCMGLSDVKDGDDDDDDDHDDDEEEEEEELR